MSFREKSAWISFVLVGLVFAAYFFPMASGELRGARQLHWYLLVTIAFIVLEVVLHIVLALQSPRDAKTPKDERERLIELKATRIAFWVLMTGALLSILTIHLGAEAGLLATHVFLAVVFAELVKFASQIVFYRRGV